MNQQNQLQQEIIQNTVFYYFKFTPQLYDEIPHWTWGERRKHPYTEHISNFFSQSEREIIKLS